MSEQAKDLTISKDTKYQCSKASLLPTSSGPRPSLCNEDATIPEERDLLVSFLVVTVLFAMMFKWLPDVSVGWRDVWLGALLTALFFEVGKAAIGFYIGKQGLEPTYGAAASIVIVLIWVYYTSQIILLGAEITHAYAKHGGSLRQRAPESGAKVRPLTPPGSAPSGRRVNRNS
jgi:hypothetical protein